MDMQLFNYGIVINANSFVPATFTQNWFLENKIFEQKDLEKVQYVNLSAQNLVISSSEEFSFLVAPQQLQFTINSNSEIDFEKIKNATIVVLKNNPVIYLSAGINFLWDILPTENESYIDLSKKLFYNTNSKTHKLFDLHGSAFGVYMSKDFEDGGCRLKCQITPIERVNIKNESQKLIQASFNFHFAKSNTNIYSELPTFINNWKKCFDETKRILNSLK